MSMIGFHKQKNIIKHIKKLVVKNIKKLVVKNIKKDIGVVNGQKNIN